jgi:hypothetical protein
MSSITDILVIIKTPEDQKRIIQEFNKLKFRVDISFFYNQDDALKFLNCKEDNQTCERLPEIIIFDVDTPVERLLEKLKKEIRLKHTAIFALVNSGLGEAEKLRFPEHRISGFVERNFVFNNYSSHNYLDLVDLHIRIMRLGLNNRQNKNSSRQE